MRFTRMGWAMVATLAIVVVVSQSALAQREEGKRASRGGRGFGGGGRGGMTSALQLATNEQVQKALKVTEEQADKIKDINDGMREERGKLRDSAGDQDANREKMQELTASAAKKLNEVLDASQQKRLMGIQIQIAGASAALDPAIAKVLNVTDDQKKKLEEVGQSNRDAMRELFEGATGQDGDREAMREKMDKQRAEANKKLMAVLTSDQQAQIESLKGEKVEIDMASLRGPGGRDRQRGERGNRGDRNREGDRNPEAKN